MRTSSIAVSLAFVFGLVACNSPSQFSIPGNASSVDLPAKHAGLQDLYVADYGRGSIVLLKNTDYSADGTITNGINGPLDVSLDRAGNLYVANASGVNVTEYTPGASSPSFTYSAGMVEPIFLTVKANESVYEVDSGNANGVGHNDGFVNEYARHSNSVLRSCQTQGHPTGIAVDSAGDIFVALNTASSYGHIVEYKGGLNGCKTTTLGVQFGFVAGIALDTNANIIATDYDRGQVDVLAPPYTKVARRLATGGRLSEPYSVSIDGTNTTVYVTDFDKNVVLVIDYASGKVVRKLDDSHGGISVPAGTADGPNAVY
ncbi:MAG: hypothetical protein WB615_05980, partial [Candidatus Tumulicola sp.]